MNLSYRVHGLLPVYVQGAMRAGGCLPKGRYILNADFIETLPDGAGAYRVMYQDAAGVNDCVAVVSRAKGGALIAREC